MALNFHSGLKRLAGTIWFWLVISISGWLVFPWCPMGLRWPLRAGIVIALGWAIGLGLRRFRFAPAEIRWRRLLQTVSIFVFAGILVVAIRPLWTMKLGQREGKVPIPSSTHSVERVQQLKEELGKLNIDLAVLGLPNCENVVPNVEIENRLPAWLENRYARKALEKISDSGTSTMDLLPIFEERARERHHWESDQVHLKREKIEEISGILQEALESRGFGPGVGSDRQIVLMGSCFAGQFAEAFRKADPKWGGLRALTGLGDQGKVADSLFLFPDRYLDGTELVIYLMSYDLLASSSLPPIRANPDLEDREAKTAIVRVNSVLGWSKHDSEEKLASLPYPNALVRLSGKVLESDDFPAGESIVMFGYGIKDRELLPLGRLRNDRRVSVNLLSYEAFASQHHKIATENVLNDGGGDFDADRFWIHSWTLIR